MSKETQRCQKRPKGVKRDSWMLQVFNKFSSELTFENVCLYLCLCLYVSVSGGGRGGRVGKVRGGSGFKYSQKSDL